MTDMPAAVYLREKHIEIRDVRKPAPAPGEALIRVTAAGICGTDMLIYAGKHPRVKPPTVLGHEFTGRIEELNGGSPFDIGARVAVEPTLYCGQCPACRSGQMQVCRTLGLVGIDRDGGFAPYAVVPIHRLHRVPDAMTDSLAALAEPAAVGVHAVRRAGVELGDRVAVLGCGPIGLIVALAARASGAAEVILSDISAYRLSIAHELGFRTVHAGEKDTVAEIRQFTAGQGADVVFEAAGTAATAAQMVQAVRTQGRIMVVSLFKAPVPVDLPAMTYRELTLLTTRCYSGTDFARGLELLAAEPSHWMRLITHELPLEQVGNGFTLMSQPEASLKIIIKP